MRIAVCVKQVPQTTEVKVNPETGTLVRAGVPSILNPFDQYALERALELKRQNGAEVVVVSMGPPQAKTVLRLALALGADRAVLLSDRAFAGADTWATSYTLARAMRKIGDVDLILCGMMAIDGDTGQTGPGIAQHLGIAQITYCESAEMNGKRLRAKRLIDDGWEKVECALPVLCTFVVPPDFTPAFPSFPNVKQAADKPLAVWSAADIEADPNCIGLKGSPTQVNRVYAPPSREKGTLLRGSATELADKILGILREEKFL